MAKKEAVVLPEATYYRLVRTERNMYSVETIIVSGDKITSVEGSDPSYLPIAFDKLRRRTGEAFFAAVQEESK